MIWAYHAVNGCYWPFGLVEFAAETMRELDNWYHIRYLYYA